MIEITPVVSHIRVYEDGKCYEDRNEYIAILTIQYINKDTVYLSGAKGMLNKRILLEINAALKSLGIKYKIYERKGRLIKKELI